MCMLLGHLSALVENALRATCFTYNITFSLLPCFQIEVLHFFPPPLSLNSAIKNYRY